MNNMGHVPTEPRRCTAFPPQTGHPRDVHPTAGGVCLSKVGKPGTFTSPSLRATSDRHIEANCDTVANADLDIDAHTNGNAGPG
jgi:hypothetical protein